MTDLQPFEIHTQSASQPPPGTRFVLNERSSSRRNFNELAASFAESSENNEPPTTSWQLLDLAGLWHGLCAGALKFQDVFDSESRCYGLVGRVENAQARAIRPRCVKVLSQLLLGETHKVVASDLGVGQSTVVAAAQEGLRSMGLACPGSRAPLLLAMAANAALLPRTAPVLARFRRVSSKEGGSLLLSIARPDLKFPTPLSPAEAAVLRQLMTGATYAQIASSRATSCRTIANQLASGFRKLGVSGRGALIAHVIARSAEFVGSRAVGEPLAVHSDPWLSLGTVPLGNGFSQGGTFRELAAGGSCEATGGTSLAPASGV